MSVCVCVCSYACVAMPNGSCSQVYQVALLHSMEDKFCCDRCSLDYHNNYDDCGWRTGPHVTAQYLPLVLLVNLLKKLNHFEL